MRKSLLTAATLAVLSVTAGQAADLPARGPAPIVAPIFTWSGFYVGANLGWGFSNSGSTTISGTPLITAVQPTGVPYSIGGGDQNALIGGVQAGYNWQVGSIVFGLEADIMGTNRSNSGLVCSTILGCGSLTTTTSSKLDWLGTVRGRLGFAFDRAMIFATGGLAYGQVKFTGNVDEFAGLGRQFYGTDSSTRTGWVAGAGAAYAFTQNWSGRIEYLYYDLGSKTVFGPQSNPVNGVEYATYNYKTDGQIIRAGIDYRF